MIAPADAGAGPPPAGPDRPLAPDGTPGEAPARRRLGWLGLAVTATSFVAGIVAASILGGTYAVARGLDQAGVKGDLGFALLSAAGLWVGFLLLPALWARRHGGARSYLGLAFRWVDVPLGLGVGLASSLATALISSVLLSRAEQDALEEKASEVVDRAQGPLAVVLLVAALCLVTPLAEEVFFRGMLFGSLQRAIRPWLAIPLAGMAFGPVHYDGKAASGAVILVQIGVLGLFGVALCALARATGRLGASIVAHAVFNSITVVTLLLQR